MKKWTLLAFVAVMAALFAAVGCKRETPLRLPPSQVHQITQELAKAASDAASGQAVVKTRRAHGSSGGTSADELYVAVRSGDAVETKIQQSVEGVASAHGLTVDPEARSGDVVRLALRSQGTISHRIEIERLPLADRQGAETAPGTPRLAILLDDLGSDRAAADAIFALHVPVTISVLPFHTHSEEIAHAARQHGCEVMLHLPMQSVDREAPEPQELKPGLSQEEVRNLVQKMLAAVPEAEGVNNHQGSQATPDADLMTELMRVLKGEGVFYVDSRTTAQTTAYDAALREGVRSAFRNVPFLDDVQGKNAVKRQLEIAIQGAKQKGEAIAIGHPHPTTLEALRETLPQTKREGVQLVFVSELVR